MVLLQRELKTQLIDAFGQKNVVYPPGEKEFAEGDTRMALFPCYQHGLFYF